MKCALYPCFDITRGKVERGKADKNVKWACIGCEGFGGEDKKMKVIEKFLLKTAGDKNFKDSDKEGAQAAIKILKTFAGLGKDFLILTGADKREMFGIEKRSGLSNIGVFSGLMRDVAIALSHNGGFRPPSLPEILLAGNGQIIGEQTGCGKKNYNKKQADELVLPPIPFPEIGGKNVCSGSPSPELDRRLREKMEVKDGDATLLLGFDL